MLNRLLPTALPLMMAACATAPEVLPFPVAQVPASLETAPMVGTGDKADDPAIWVNPLDGERSLILGTNKDAGLHIYDLTGAELQFLPVGRLNNVDLRGDIAVGSNDEAGGISWFRIDGATATVAHLGNSPVERIEPYGICAGMLDGIFTAAVTYKDGAVELWAAPAGDDAMLSPTLVRTVQLASQLEGCVFHDSTARLFIGEENHGIWVLDLADPASLPAEIDTIAAGNGLVADVEGLSIWDDGEGEAYLVASAQAADRFVVYSLEAPYPPVGIFTVTASTDGTVDAVSHTDGLDVSAAALPGYPKGLLVVQDDGNPRSGQSQNFKLVDWSLIEAGLQE